MKHIIIGLFFFYICSEARMCPDLAKQCPDWGTCCENADTSFGCCPYKDAECCSDFIHCCPLGSHCNVTRRSCDSNSLKASSTSLLWMVPHYDPETVSDAFGEGSTTKFELPHGKDRVGDTCPDGRSCQKGATCCPIAGNEYGCCPYRDAVCCEDKQHCCPEGYICDLLHSQCVKRFSSNMTGNPDSFPIFNIAKNEFDLPVKRDLCDHCLESGKVCCSNGNTVTCCPRGTTCSSNSNRCELDLMEFAYFSESLLTNNVEEKLEMVCPDKTESCPNDNTCCQMASGNFGCCPLPKATCCPDQLTCCPHNYVCIGDNQCERKSFLHLMNTPVFLERLPYQ